MKKLSSLLLVFMLCFGITFAFSETPTETEWDWVPFDAMLKHNIITDEQMAEIETFIENEHDIIASGNLPKADEPLTNLYKTIMLEAYESGESTETILARVCLWELVLVGIITEDQLMQTIHIQQDDSVMTPDTEYRMFYTAPRSEDTPAAPNTPVSAHDASYTMMYTIH